MHLFLLYIICVLLCRTVCRTPTKNPMNLRVQLRKVNLMRQNHFYFLFIIGIRAKTWLKLQTSHLANYFSFNSILRSPGGTPLCNKENDVMDSSLDPSMTRGLGNQYLVCKPLYPKNNIRIYSFKVLFETAGLILSKGNLWCEMKWFISFFFVLYRVL